MLSKAVPISAAFLVGTMLSANAQPTGQAYPDYRNYPAPTAAPYAVPRRSPWPDPSTPLPSAPAVPPSWYYNPYTDGTVRDPRGGGGP